MRRRESCATPTTGRRSGAVSLAVLAVVLAALVPVAASSPPPGGAAAIVDPTTVVPVGSSWQRPDGAVGDLAALTPEPGGGAVGVTSTSVVRIDADGMWHIVAGLFLGKDATTAPDGTVWVLGHETVARLEPAGTLARAPAAEVGYPWRLDAAPDGSVWATDLDGDALVHVAPDLTVTRHTDPGIIRPRGVAVAADGSVWFGTEHAGLGRRAPDGAVTYPGPATRWGHTEIAVDADGAAWVLATPTSVARVAPDGAITTYEVPDDPVEAIGIGPDGRPWFVAGGVIGRVAADGTLEAVVDDVILSESWGDVVGAATGAPVTVAGRAWLPAALGSIVVVDPDGTWQRWVGPGLEHPLHAASAPDGTVWFVDHWRRAVGRLEPDGSVSLHAPAGFASVGALAVDVAGVVWFTADDDLLGRIDVDGTATVVTRSEPSSSVDVAIGSDGLLWGADTDLGQVSRTTGAGVTTHLDVPGAPTSIVAGPDGALWFTTRAPAGVGRITTAGAVTHRPDDRLVDPAHLAVAPDGTLWLATGRSGELARVAADGTLTLHAVAGVDPVHDLLVGPDANPWVATNSWSGDGDVVRVGGDGSATAFAGGASCCTTAVATAPGGGVWALDEHGVARIQAWCGDLVFSDVRHEHPFCTAITWMAASGIATGHPDGTFRPGEPVQRQAMAAFLWRAAGSPPVTDPDPRFADVPADHPFFDAIQWMGATGRSTGTPDPDGGLPRFEPGAAVSRQAMAAFVWRDAGAPSVALRVPLYLDVPADHPFFDAVQWLAQAGIATLPELAIGGGTTFQPGGDVSRQATASFLFRAARRAATAPPLVP